MAIAAAAGFQIEMGNGGYDITTRALYMACLERNIEVVQCIVQGGAVNRINILFRPCVARLFHLLESGTFSDAGSNRVVDYRIFLHIDFDGGRGVLCVGKGVINKAGRQDK